MSGKKSDKPDQIRESSLTYDDYAALPDDGNRYELAAGILEMMSPGATPVHQMIAHQLEYKITQSCEAEYIILDAPVDVILSLSEVRQPDLVMIHRSRISIITKRGIEGPPDLVVEIMSPSSIRRDRVSKTKTYARYAIPEYWIVDPFSKVLEQYVLKEQIYELNEVYSDDELVKSEHIHCISFTMNDIMKNIPALPDC